MYVCLIHLCFINININMVYHIINITTIWLSVPVSCLKSQVQLYFDLCLTKTKNIFHYMGVPKILDLFA